MYYFSTRKHTEVTLNCVYIPVALTSTAHLYRAAQPAKTPLIKHYRECTD